MDGTLLDDRKELPDENVRALEELVRAGGRVAISSGRMIPTIEPLADRLGIDVLVIAYNGGKVVGTRAEGRPLILHRPLAADVFEELLEMSRREDLLLNYYHDDCLYAEETPGRQALIDLYHRRTGSVYHFTNLDRFRGTPPTKLIILASPPERERLLARLAEEFQGRVDLARSEPEYLEITAPGVHKGASLPALAEHLGIRVSEIVAVGDAGNDHSMLRAAGLGVAVANADEETRRLADRVTRRTNNEAAVAEVVREILLDGGAVPEE